jgi:hypothetical protein
MLPQKRVLKGICHRTNPRTAHNLALRINAFRETRAGTKRPQVRHDAVTPEEAMMHNAARQIGLANDVSGIVEPERFSVISSQSA